MTVDAESYMHDRDIVEPTLRHLDAYEAHQRQDMALAELHLLEQLNSALATSARLQGEVFQPVQLANVRALSVGNFRDAPELRSEVKRAEHRASEAIRYCNDALRGLHGNRGGVRYCVEQALRVLGVPMVDVRAAAITTCEQR